MMTVIFIVFSNYPVSIFKRLGPLLPNKSDRLPLGDSFCEEVAGP
jgi:hypothetical protein